MAQRSTRNKIRFHASNAYASLEKAQNSLTAMAALAEGRSPVIEQNLPEIMAALKFLADAVNAMSKQL